MSVINRDNFIERSIMGALSFLKECVFSDEYASRKAFLQSMDPRIKLVAFASFILAILFARSIAACLALYVLCLVLAYISKIRLGFFLKRTWIFIPIFSLFIAIPALFSIFTPGEPIAGFSIARATFIITRQGLYGAVLFVMRVISSVSFAVLLSITTRHFVLLRVLRVAGIPQVFVMILGMCYRYIYLFAELIENTYLAIKSRVGRPVHYKQGQSIAAWNMAFLWYRSYRMNEDVYNAMISRGYTGEPVTVNDFKSGPKDWAMLLFSLLVLAAYIYAGYTEKLP